MNSVVERFGNLAGLLMQQKIDECYFITPDITLPYFIDGSQKQQTFSRHKCNDRVQDSVIAEWKKSVLAKGVMANQRGRPCVVPDPEVKGAYLMLTNASLTQAFYQAVAEDAMNLYVVASAT